MAAAVAIAARRKGGIGRRWEESGSIYRTVEVVGRRKAEGSDGGGSCPSEG